MASPTNQAAGPELWLHLDLDYTLFEVTLPPNRPSALPEGEQRRYQQLWTENSSPGPEVHITTINHRKFTQLFEKIEGANRAQQRDVVVVDILTDSTYGESCVRTLLKELFPALKISNFYNRNRAVTTKHDHIDAKFKTDDSSPLLKCQVALVDDNLRHCVNTRALGYKVVPMGVNPAQDARGFDWLNAQVEKLNEVDEDTGSDMEELAEQVVSFLGI